MRKLLSRISNYLDVPFTESVLSNLKEDELRRIRHVNYISMISIGYMLLYLTIYCILDFYLFKHAIVFLSMSSIFILMIIVFNNKGRHLLAKILLSVMMPVFMGYISAVVFDQSTGFQVYLFLATLIPLFLWSIKDKIYPISIITGIVALYCVIEFLPPFFEPKILLPENYAYIFRQTNFAASFAGAGLAVGTFQYLYRIQEKVLIDKKEELLLSQAHKDKIYSVIAHDLRGPLGSIVELSDIFLQIDDPNDEEERLKTIRSMHQTSASLLFLLENLLDWSKMQSGNVDRSKNNLNLYKMVKEALVPYNPQFGKKKQNVDVKVDQSITVYANLHKVSTVLRNVISNANKFTGENGVISVTAHEKDLKVVVCIEDSGPGLSEIDIDNLFDIRKVSKITGSRHEKGSGLGLLLSKEFIESMDGEIWIESELGKGSRFCFSLPTSK